jgi:hypothetical protein
MKSSFRPLVLGALALGLLACSTREIPFDKTSAGVQRIGLLTPGFPSGPSVVVASDPGQSFGLVGALVDAGLQSNRDGRFKAILVKNSFVPPNNFWGALVAQLEKDGYVVAPVPASQNRSDFVKLYPPTSPSVDAYLDVVVDDYGYLAAGIGGDNPYRPFLVLHCKLVRASDSAVLMQDRIAVNAVNQGAGGWAAPKLITISPDPAFVFPGMDELTANPKQAVDGTKSAFTQSTDAIGKLLK